MKLSTVLLAAIVPLAAGCGDDTGHGAHDAGSTPTDVPAITDTPSVTDAPATTSDTPVVASDAPAADAPAMTSDTGATIPRLNDCTATDYVDRSGAMDDRTVVPRGSTGYTPRCVTIRAGQTVTFSMNFTTHPLIAGVPHGSSAGATTPSPIETQRSGTSYAVAFANAGYYPFYCTIHGHVGMAGVVRVVP